MCLVQWIAILHTSPELLHLPKKLLLQWASNVKHRSGLKKSICFGRRKVVLGLIKSSRLQKYELIYRILLLVHVMRYPNTGTIQTNMVRREQSTEVHWKWSFRSLCSRQYLAYFLWWLEAAIHPHLPYENALLTLQMPKLLVDFKGGWCAGSDVIDTTPCSSNCRRSCSVSPTPRIFFSSLPAQFAFGVSMWHWRHWTWAAWRMHVSSVRQCWQATKA